MAVVFDGDDDYIAIGTVNGGDDLSLTSSAFSVAFWMRPDTSSTPDAAQRVIAKTTGGTATNGWAIIVNPTSGLWLIASNGTSPLSFSQDCPDDQWLHCVATLSSTTAAWYINGFRRIVATGSFSLPPNASATTYIGRWNSGARDYKGALEDLTVWNVELTQAQAHEVAFNSHHDVASGNIVARWKMRETSGTNVPDTTGNWDGTLTNGPTWETVELPNATRTRRGLHWIESGVSA